MVKKKIKKVVKRKIVKNKCRAPSNKSKKSKVKKIMQLTKKSKKKVKKKR